MTQLIVAIDGPGGVGKSTTSRLVAERLGAAHLDTGAFYRAATLAVLEAGADPADSTAVIQAMAGRRIDQGGSRTTLDGRDVSTAIRTDEVTASVSTVSAHPDLRKRMVEAQQQWVHRHADRAVVEGRDIGTVVFPDATVKVFLDADPAVRAARRSGEIGRERGEVAEALARRDALDSTRVVSPLVAAADAVVIDTTHLSVAEVVERIVSLLPDGVL
jgi:cytidylate kinase